MVNKKKSQILVCIIYVSLGVCFSEGLFFKVNIFFPYFPAFLITVLMITTVAATQNAVSKKAINLASILTSLFLIFSLPFLVVGKAFNTLGYLQLNVFLLLTIFLRYSLFPSSQMTTIRKALLFWFYIQCAFVFLGVVSWELFRVDLNFLSPLPEIRDIIAFRPAGLSREPAWAALNISITMLGVAKTHAKKNLKPLFILYVTCIYLLQSMTGLILALTLFATEFRLFEKGSSVSQGHRRALRYGVVIILIVAALIANSPRIANIATLSDASTNMRVSSFLVALEVINENGLFGVGYGNFREHAAYGFMFDNFIDLENIVNYKSDSSFLNLWAEIGVFGIFLACLFTKTLTIDKTTFMFSVMILLLFGTIIVPSILILALISGLRLKNDRK